MIRVSCDGCGSDVEDFEELGLFDKHQYCPACATTAKEFLEKRDALHEKVAGQWSRDLEKLKKSYDIALPT